MTGLEIAALTALITSAGSQIGGSIAGARGRKKSAEAMWGEDEKRRLRALEREEALGMLGADEARSERIMQQSLDPVQAAEREAQAKTAAQFAASVGAGGQYFRGTTAMQEAGMQERTAATKSGQEQERMAAAQQKAMKKAEIDALRQQRMQSELLLSGSQGQAAREIGQAAGDVGMQAVLFAQQQQEIESLRQAGSATGEYSEADANEILKSMDFYLSRHLKQG